MTWAFSLLAGALILATPGALGAGIVEVPIKKRFDASSAVVIAKAVSDERTPEGKPKSVGVVTFELEVSLKGSVPPRFDLITRVSIAELGLDCCVKGKTYLLFLKNADDKAYLSENGKYGVAKITYE